MTTKDELLRQLLQEKQDAVMDELISLEGEIITVERTLKMSLSAIEEWKESIKKMKGKE